MTRREVVATLLGTPAFARLASMAQLDADDPLVWLDVSSLVAQRSEKLTSRVTEAYLRRIARYNSELNAYVTVTADLARDQARRADLVPPLIIARGDLHGVPIAHKDLFETAGIRTTAGSRLFDTYIPKRDATIVSKLASEGAIMLGKTNTHELGSGVTTINPFYGTTRNPWNQSRIPGGSSGGSAVAVVAGLAAAASGSDTGGSVRIPAAFCGCVGFKPTFGRVSTAGLLGASPTFDHSAILARTVADAHLIYRQVAGYDPADPSTVPTPYLPGPTRPSPSVNRLRIGVARNYFFDALAPDVARAIEEAIDGFRSGSAEVRDITFPIDSKTMSRVFDPIIVSEVRDRFATDWKKRPQAFSKSFAAFLQAPVPSTAELVASHRALREYQRAVRETFDNLEIVVTPTVPITAPRIDGRIDGPLILRNTWPFNAARTPAISVPCGFDSDGLPIGIQLVAAPYDEDTLFRAAQHVEMRNRWHRRRPSL